MKNYIVYKMNSTSRFANFHQVENQKYYSTFGFSFQVPNLLDVQRERFQSFLETGLQEAFQTSLEISTLHHSFELQFFPEFVQFRKPDFDEKQCFLLGKTYGSSVYIPVGVKFKSKEDHDGPQNSSQNFKNFAQGSVQNLGDFVIGADLEKGFPQRDLRDGFQNVKSNFGSKSKKSRNFRIEWLHVGFLPLLTKQGHFLINGIPRVVLYQMVRNPGIYSIQRDSRTQTGTIRIVPEKGGWMNLTVDKKYRLWFTTRSLRRKVSLLVILQALGFPLPQLFQRLRHSVLLQNSCVKEFSSQSQEAKTRHDKILVRAGLQNHPATQQEAWQYLYAHVLEYSPYSRIEKVTPETARDFFIMTFWNNQTRFLGSIGRQQFREKVQSPEPPEQFLLTAEDILLATQALLDLIYKERVSDEIDSLTQKRIRGCDEFLKDQLILGIQEFQSFFTRKITTLPPVPVSSQTLKNLSPKFGKKNGDTQQYMLENLWRQNRAVFSKFISKSWKSFFTSGTLAQYMDQTNPLAETTHKRRLTVLGPGGVNKKQTTIQIRGIHPTYYGRLCPIETPEGQNAGLVNSFTALATPSPNFFGTIMTPFFQVYKGQIQKNLPPLQISPHQEYAHIGAPPDIRGNFWNLLPQSSLPVRKNLKFDSENAITIQTQSVGVLQTISVATSLIPFLEHDDANRALMGSNMQRQAVPLLKPQAPYVGTGLETRVVSDVNHVIQAAQSGYITKITSKTIKTISFAFDSTLYPKSKELAFHFSREKWIIQKSHFWKGIPFFENRKGKEIKSGKNILPKIDRKVCHFFSEKVSPSIFFQFKKSSQNSQKRLGPLSKNFILGKVSAQIRRRGLIKHISFSHAKLSLVSNLKLNFGNPQKIQPISSDPKIDFNFWKLKKDKIHRIFENGREIQNLEPNFGKVSFFQNGKKNEIFGQIVNKCYNLTVYERTNQSTCRFERPLVSERDWVEKGEILADGAASSSGKLSIGQNVLVAYIPWEGYNFEDAILVSERFVDQDVFTSLHIDHYEIEVKNTQYGLEKITNQIPLKINESTRDIQKIEKLNSRGLVEIGSWVEAGDYLVGKISPLNPKGPSVDQQYEKLYNIIMQREKTNFRNTSLRVPKGVEGFVLDVQILPSQEPDVAALARNEEILKVRVVLLQRRRIQVGDKMAGRHGNKGIVSQILRREDMPYLPDGTPVDIVLNPLGVPSRMNVGQILECLLGLAGQYLQETYTTHLFDEQFGGEASRSLVFSKLYEASLKTGNPWLFEPHHPGKVKLFDGRTGLPFDQPVTVGYPYMLKLVHLVDDKIHARSTGPYSAVTQQPVRGRSRNGGQRLGEMEVWALQAYGAASTLHELLTLKSDDIEGRKQAVVRIYANKPLPSGHPESFKVLFRELQSLCFDLQLYTDQQGTEKSIPLSFRRIDKLLLE